MKKYRISFQNEGGELAFREVHARDGADEGPALKTAAIDLLEEISYLSVGDQLIITDQTE